MSSILFDLVYSICPSPWVRKIPWRRAWQPTPVFNPMERGDWQATAHRVTKSQTQLKRLSTHIYPSGYGAVPHCGFDMHLICICIRANDQLRQHIKKQRHYSANKGPSGQSYGFSSSHVGMRELDYKESWVLKNWCFWTVVLEKILESPLDCKEVKPVYPKGNQSWIFFGRTDAEGGTPTLLATRCEELTNLKSPWCWERLMVGGEGDDRGWDGWMASPTRCTWVWVNSGSWWWTGKPGVLQYMGLQRVRHDWVTGLNWGRISL